MTPIGETLRRERLRRNLDLEQISSELKISPRFLEAIEDEQFDRLPGAVFAKAFVRQYARLLALDADEFAGQMQQLIEPVMQLPKFAEMPHQNGAPAIHVPRMEAWESTGDQKFSWPSWIPAAGLLVLAMLACSGIYAWWQRDRHTVTAQAPATQSPVTASAPAPIAPAPATVETPPHQPAATPSTDPPPAASKQAPETVPAAVVPAPAASAPAVAASPAPNPNATVHLAVTAEEPAWISARADGKYLFSGTLSANETRTVEAADSLTLRLGNAGGVNITLNGKPVEKLGAKGQARTVQFTSGGFQIVAAPKPSLPFAPI